MESESKSIYSIQDLTKELEDQLSRLYLVEKEIGYSSDQMEQTKISLFQSITCHVESYIDKIHLEKQEIIEQTELAQKEIASFKKLMGEYASNQAVLDSSQSLQANLNEITAEKAKVEERYNERLALVKELYAQLEGFKEAMGDFVNTDMLKCIDVDVSSLAVNALEEEIQRCENEYIHRKEQVDEGVKQTLSLLVTLGIEVESDRDRIIESYYREIDPTEKMHLCNMLVSLDFMSYIKKRTMELDEQKRQVEFRKEEIIHSLKQLWHRLHIDSHECEVFLMANRGLTCKEMQKFEDELSRLSILKKERIGEFIETTREELKSLWEQLFYSDKQKEQFATMFTSTELTDTLLEAHESEISRLQLELEDSRYIIELIEKHIKLKKEVEEFETMTSDPNRLFGKGQRDPGRLLREEKFRKRVARELPKVIKELEGSLLEYEALKGRPFLVYGKPYYDVLYEEQKQTNTTAVPHKQQQKTPKRDIPARKPMTSPRINRTKKLFFNTPQPTRVKSLHQLQPIEAKIDTSESILYQVRANNIRQQQAKRTNIFDDESDDEDTTLGSENVNSTVKHKAKKRAASRVETHCESDDSIGLDLGIFDDGPDLSDMSEIDA